MIKINENNILDWIETPWNSNPLGMVSNEIINFISENGDIANTLLTKFEIYSAKIKYTSVRVESTDFHLVRALGKNGYSMTEFVYKLSSNLSKFVVDRSLFKDYKYVSMIEPDRKQIENLSVKYFNHGKFHEDPLIERKVADQRNVNMVRDLTKHACTKVGKIKGKVFAFMIFKKIDNKRVDLILGGVHKDFRKYSYSFWHRVLSQLKDEGLLSVTTTISAANMGAVRLYNNLGFRYNKGLYGYRKFR
jgi:ribosomal protein S18 acetylase RimI-like enzyme